MKELTGKIGTNGVVFGPGYKGPGMCANCLCRYKKVPNRNDWLCSYYVATCKSVSRNCAGIRHFKQPTNNEEKTTT